MSRWLTGAGLLAGFAIGRRRATPPDAAPAIRDWAPAPDARVKAANPGETSFGETGAGEFYATFPDEPAAVAAHLQFQFAGAAHQDDTALSGMWLFLSTELLFFGGLLLLDMIYRSLHPAGMAEGARHTDLAIGTANTAILLTSGAVYAYGIASARRGDRRRLVWASLLTAALGTAFLVLKGLEWSGDLTKHLFPDAAFAIGGPDLGGPNLGGPDQGGVDQGGVDQGGAKLFWSYYFVATGLHGLHMIVGIVLVLWIALRARRGDFLPGYVTPVEVVGLYWGFVDMVWCVLYPTLYLAGGLQR